MAGWPNWLQCMVPPLGALRHYVASSTRAVPIYVDPPLFTFTAQAVCRESIELLHVELRGAVW